jgi:hypothetical protein
MGEAIKFRGKEYPVHDVTPEIIAYLESFLEGSAWEKVERTRGDCDEATYRTRMDSLTRLIAAGTFEWGTQMMASFAGTPKGIKYCLYLQMRAADPQNDEITEKLVDEIWEEKQAEALASLQPGKAPAGTAPSP